MQGVILTASPISLQSRCTNVLNDAILTYGDSWPQPLIECSKQETDKARRKGETAISGHYGTRHVQCTPREV